MDSKTLDSLVLDLLQQAGEVFERDGALGAVTFLFDGDGCFTDIRPAQPPQCLQCEEGDSNTVPATTTNMKRDAALR